MFLPGWLVAKNHVPGDFGEDSKVFQPSMTKKNLLPGLLDFPKTSKLAYTRFFKQLS